MFLTNQEIVEIQNQDEFQEFYSNIWSQFQLDNGIVEETFEFSNGAEEAFICYQKTGVLN